MFPQLPYFMNELTLIELDMGCSMPQIATTSRPEVNHRGEDQLGGQALQKNKQAMMCCWCDYS